jgi:uncharacterized protein YjbK
LIKGYLKNLITLSTIANWKGKTSHVKENPKQISYYIDSKMAELKYGKDRIFQKIV